MDACGLPYLHLGLENILALPSFIMGVNNNLDFWPERASDCFVQLT